MTAALDRIELVEDLRQAMDELCAPDLTLARAEVLRSRVAWLLEALRESPEKPVGHRFPAVSPRSIGRG